MADNVVTLEKVAQGTKGPEELLPPEGKGEKVAIRVFEILKEIIDHKEALGLIVSSPLQCSSCSSCWYPTHATEATMSSSSARGRTSGSLDLRG